MEEVFKMENLLIPLLFVLSSIISFTIGARSATIKILMNRQQEMIFLLKAIKKLDEITAFSGKSLKDMSLQELSIKLAEQVTLQSTDD